MGRTREVGRTDNGVEYVSVTHGSLLSKVFYKEGGVIYYSNGMVEYRVKGSNVTEELLALIEDPANLLPHEVGLIKLKYDLVPQQLKPPNEFLDEITKWGCL